jgi:hypothetical protein
MSIQAVKYVLEQSKIHGQARLVLICLAYHANPAALAWPSRDLLAREARLRPTEIQSALKVLTRCGEIELTRPGSSRCSRQFLLSGYVRSLNVGGPTLETPEGEGEETPRKTPFPSQKQGSTPFPLNSGGTDSRSREFAGTDSRSPEFSGTAKTPKSAIWEPIAVPRAPFSVPTEFSGNGNLENRQGGAPLHGAIAANRQGSEPAAAPGPEGAGRNGSVSAEWYRLLNQGFTPADARRELKARGLLPAGGNGNGREKTDREAAAEFFAHVKRVAAGEEPIEPAEQECQPEKESL